MDLKTIMDLLWQVKKIVPVGLFRKPSNSTPVKTEPLPQSVALPQSPLGVSLIREVGSIDREIHDFTIGDEAMKKRIDDLFDCADKEEFLRTRKRLDLMKANNQIRFLDYEPDPILLFLEDFILNRMAFEMTYLKTEKKSGGLENADDFEILWVPHGGLIPLDVSAYFDSKEPFKYKVIVNKPSLLVSRRELPFFIDTTVSEESCHMAQKYLQDSNGFQNVKSFAYPEKMIVFMELQPRMTDCLYPWVNDKSRDPYKEFTPEHTITFSRGVCYEASKETEKILGRIKLWMGNAEPDPRTLSEFIRAYSIIIASIDPCNISNQPVFEIRKQLTETPRDLKDIYHKGILPLNNEDLKFYSKIFLPKIKTISEILQSNSGYFHEKSIDRSLIEDIITNIEKTLGPDVTNGDILALREKLNRLEDHFKQAVGVDEERFKVEMMNKILSISTPEELFTLRDKVLREGKFNLES